MHIILHTKEERKKCTLAGIREEPSFTFSSENDHEVGTGALLLHPRGSPLTGEDRTREFVLLDATWKNYLKLLQRDPVLSGLERRSIQGYVTAYPRKGKKAPHPENHLASIEVIIAVGLILRIPEYSRLLDTYHFRKEFMKKNRIGEEQQEFEE